MPEMLGRRAVLVTGGLRLELPQLGIDFRVGFDDQVEADDAEVTVYNLSDDTANSLRAGAAAVLSAGYGRDVGTLLAGEIVDVRGRWEGPTRATTLTITDASDLWAEIVVNRSYAPGIKASKVITDVLQACGLEVGALSLPDDVVYRRGRVASGQVQAVLSELAADCGAVAQLIRGALYIRDPEAGTETGFVLRADSGLVGTPQRIEQEDGEAAWGVWSLLHHRIRAGSLIRVESRAVTGLLRVRRGMHVCNSQDFLTYMEGLPL